MRKGFALPYHAREKEVVIPPEWMMLVDRQKKTYGRYQQCDGSPNVRKYNDWRSAIVFCIRKEGR